jgi:hypothetical protein
MLFVVNARMRRTQVNVIPEVIGQIYYDGFGSAANNNPLERGVARRIDLLVWKPCRDEEEIACVQGGIKLPAVTPPNVRRAAQNIGDRVLLSVVVYSRPGPRFDEEETSPHRGSHAGSWMDSGNPQRSGRLRSCRIELRWADYTNRLLLHEFSLDSVERVVRTGRMTLVGITHNLQCAQIVRICFRQLRPEFALRFSCSMESLLLLCRILVRNCSLRHIETRHRLDDLQ